MIPDLYMLVQLQHRIDAEQKKYQKAIENDKDLEKAKIIFYKIKELKKALDAKNISTEMSQYLHSH